MIIDKFHHFHHHDERRDTFFDTIEKELDDGKGNSYETIFKRIASASPFDDCRWRLWRNRFDGITPSTKIGIAHV